MRVISGTRETREMRTAVTSERTAKSRTAREKAGRRKDEGEGMKAKTQIRMTKPEIRLRQSAWRRVD